MQFAFEPKPKNVKPKANRRLSQQASRKSAGGYSGPYGYEEDGRTPDWTQHYQCLVCGRMLEGLVCPEDGSDNVVDLMGHTSSLTGNLPLERLARLQKQAFAEHIDEAVDTRAVGPRIAKRKTAYLTVEDAIAAAQKELSTRRQFNSDQGYDAMKIDSWPIYAVPTRAEANGVIFDDEGGYRFDNAKDEWNPNGRFGNPVAIVNADGSVQRFSSRRKTAISDGYWAAVDAQIEQLKSARSSADVIRILGPESASSGDAFFNGEGDEMEGALLDAGWRTYRYEAPYYWVMKAPDGSLITYTEGDVSKGDDANVGPKESRRKTAAASPKYSDIIAQFDDLQNSLFRRRQDTNMTSFEQLRVERDVMNVIHQAKQAFVNIYNSDGRFGSRKTAATAPGYYLVGRASNIIEGPFVSLVQAEARQPEVKAAAIEYKSGVEDPQWESMKAQPFPYGLNTVNGSRRKVANQYVEKRGDKWVVTQKGTGKVLSTHDTKEKAEASFRAMMVNKHGGSRKTADNSLDWNSQFVNGTQQWRWQEDGYVAVVEEQGADSYEYWIEDEQGYVLDSGDIADWLPDAMDYAHDSLKQFTGSRKRAYYTDGNGGQYEDDSWGPDTRIGCSGCGWSGTAKEADGSNDPSYFHGPYFYGSDFFCPDCGKNSMLYPLDLDESGDYTFAKRAVKNYINNGGW